MDDREIADLIRDELVDVDVTSRGSFDIDMRADVISRLVDLFRKSAEKTRHDYVIAVDFDAGVDMWRADLRKGVIGSPIEQTVVAALLGDLFGIAKNAILSDAYPFVKYPEAQAKEPQCYCDNNSEACPNCNGHESEF